jgi:hypothetical protein
MDKLKGKFKKSYKQLFELLKEDAWERIKEIVTIETFKLAINYEEKNTKFYTAKEMIKWFKENYKQNYEPCVYMLKAEIDGDAIYKLHHVFIDNDKEPCLDGSVPYRKVIARQIDDEIVRMFGDKDMIILRLQ